MMWVNPIPYVDAGKEFEMRLHVKLDQVTEANKAIELVADYILGLSKEELIKGIACTKSYAVFPEDWGHKR